MAVGLVFLASSQCQFCDREGLCCSMSTGTTAGWIKPFDGRRASDSSVISFRCRSTFFGAMQSHLLPAGQDLSLSKLRVAADNSDSVPDAIFEHIRKYGYHPLEKVKKHKDRLLTDAEIARTLVEANSKALLVFPGSVHCEPHGHESWAESQYIIDDYGDIFFEFFDDKNILQDPGASSPVTVLIGMDNTICGESRMTTGNYAGSFGRDTVDAILFKDDYNEVDNSEVADMLIKRGMPETLRWIHPMYFAKCLAKSAHSKYGKGMDCPSNGISIVGCLIPAFKDEESYLRRLFCHEDGDGYTSDWRDESEKEEEQVSGTYNNLIGGETLNLKSSGRRGNVVASSLYRLEIMTMELFTIYGDQSTIGWQEFQDAEPDVLVNSASAIIERFNEYGRKFTMAVKAICRRKGLIVERANMIGVDSLGMDVRVFSGMEAQTLRFSFNNRATSERSAEEQIDKMLFPRNHHRKSSRTARDGVRDLTSF